MVALLLDISCVENMEDSVMLDCRARINAVFVIGSIRKKNRSRKLPVNKILTAVVSPALSSVTIGIIGRILEIYMIITAEKTETVRIVKPAMRRFEVNLLPPFTVNLCHIITPLQVREVRSLELLLLSPCGLLPKTRMNL